MPMGTSWQKRSGCARVAAVLACALAVGSGLCQSPTVPQHPLDWITLGTQGGPAPNPQRSQPANVLLVGNKAWIVDCGDGAMERFAAAGFAPPQANTVFISHLHVDHIAGLQGIIALHWFRGSVGSTPVTVYGPPGTDKLVAGIVQSLEPTEAIAQAEQPGKWSPADSVKVVTLKGGADMTIDGVRVRAVQNSHFDNPPGHPQDNGTQSLSYRFDSQGYAIGYTGDTGPSDAVVALEHHVNILFSEVTQRGAAGAMGGPRRRPAGTTTQPGPGQQPGDRQKINAGTVPAGPGPGMRLHTGTDRQFGQFHFQYQHLSAANAAKLAAAAGVQCLVFTHLAIPGPTDSVAPRLIQQARQFFKGKVKVAHDLERF